MFLRSAPRKCRSRGLQRSYNPTAPVPETEPCGDEGKAAGGVPHLAGGFAVSGLRYSASLWKTRQRFKTNVPNGSRWVKNLASTRKYRGLLFPKCGHGEFSTSADTVSRKKAVVRPAAFLGRIGRPFFAERGRGDGR